jgi:hypothetical protein
MNVWISPPPDAWILRGPDEARRPCVDDVQSGLHIEVGELSIDATGVYETETGALVSVIINGKHVSPEQVARALAILCPGDTGTWDADLDSGTLNDLCADAAASHADGLADWQRDMRDGF